MSSLRKATLGPARAVRCDACGKRVSVGAASVLVVIPFLAGIGAAWYFHGSALGIAALVGGTLAMFLAHEFAVPLVRRDA